MRRIFIALKVEAGDTLLMMINELKQGLRSDSVKWTDTDNIHITLAFLGDTAEDLIHDIGSMLGDRCSGYGQFELILSGAGVFKSRNKPHVIWGGIEPSEKLAGLFSIIAGGLADSGISIEERPFRPHLTLGRIRHLNYSSNLNLLLDKYQNSDLQKVPVNEVVLYESVLMRTGPVYKPLGKYKL